MKEYPIIFYPSNVLYTDESFIYIPNSKVPNVQNCRYMISNYGRVYDTYTNLFVIGRMSNGIIYLELEGEFALITVELTWLIATMFYEQTAPFPRLIDRRTRTLYHKDNIEWSDQDKEDRDTDKNIRIVNGQRVHIGEGSNFPTKLNEEKVHQICKLLVEDKYSLPEIGKMFNVSLDAIFRIKKGKNWKHISCNYDIPEPLSREERSRGENNPTSKYKESQIRQVCELLEQHKYSNVEIANKTNTTKSLVSHIKNHKRWNHISKEYNF